MKTSTLIKIVIAIVVVIVAVNIFISNFKSSYEEMVHDWRKQRDRFFKEENSSPIEDKENFQGLNYFPPDMKFRVDAHLTLLRDTIPLSMLRTDGKSEKYRKYAIATFTINKKEYQVLLLQSLKSKEYENVLFFPFTDKTTGELTYGAGRYIDIEQTEPGKVVIDFNYAYNPYCAYNSRFSCPIPPRENYIDEEILAGEKIYQKEGHPEPDTLTIH